MKKSTAALKGTTGRTTEALPPINPEYKGLQPEEANRRFTQYGPNLLTSRKKKSTIALFFKQFKDYMTLILFASTVISAFMGEIIEAVSIVAIILMNGVLGFIQEYRTEKTLEALKKLAAPTCKVVRGGTVSDIPADELVPGDLILLEEGARIPADAVLIEAKNLNVDESLLTGESVPVEKSAMSLSSLKQRKYNLTEEGNGKHKDAERLCMGTVVTRGRGRAVVYATGMSTEMGKIADMIQTAEESQTPLQRRLEQLGKYIIIGCLAICAVVAVAGILRGEDAFDMLLAGISLAVAAVPEGLPAIVTISLALGVQRMLKRKALVRVLPAVETLGCADIICSDKTGTLTENRMTVREIFTGEKNIKLSNADNGTNEFTMRGKTFEPRSFAPLKLALETAALCNNSRISLSGKNGERLSQRLKSKFRGDETLLIDGDPTEAALMMAALNGGMEKELLGDSYVRLDEIPFDSDRKCMSVVCKNKEGRIHVYTKGAPDVVLSKCTGICTEQGNEPLSKEHVRRIIQMTDKMAAGALRVLGLAYKPFNGGSTKSINGAHGQAATRQEGETHNGSVSGVSGSGVESELVFIGLIGMIDPPRREAYSAVEKCMLSGIKPVMITGDHKITACAIAGELRIFQKGDGVLTGSEIDSLGDEEFSEAADKVSVFARVTPGHKLKIVRALKKKGHIVAMTGDGVNDAPAVKEADIGVAMGETGTDVTREASSMILMDDNFATIVAAIEEGRAIYENIRKFIRYLLSCNIGEVLTMFLGIILGFPVPLLPIQILWINLVTDGLPAIALGLEPAEKDIMQRAPRKLNSSVFSDGLGSLIVIRGLFIGLSTLAVFATVLHYTADTALARTAAFVTLILAQLIHVYECKSEKKTIFEIPLFNNKYLVGATITSTLMMLAAVYLPFSPGIFGTVPLTIKEWTLIIGFTFLGPALAGVFRKLTKCGRKTPGQK